MNALSELAAQLRRDGPAVRAWLETHAHGLAPPLTLSVDLRRSHAKAAVVDSNVFPAGLHNLCEVEAGALPGLLRHGLPEVAAGARVGVLAESFDRNPGYARSVEILRRSLERAGFKAEPLTFEGPGPTLERAGLRLAVRTPAGRRFLDAVVLNGDLATGLPPALDGTATPVWPWPGLGWWNRSKAMHFGHLNALASAAAREFGADPWLLSALHDQVDDVDFAAGLGLERLADRVDSLLARVGDKLREHGAPGEPTVFVKPDRGTFGMGVLPVSSGDEVLRLNSRKRSWMARGKQGLRSHRMLLQEGVPTLHRHGGHAAEPVLVLAAGEPVGAFLRSHPTRGPEGNLNAPGAVYVPDCPHQEPAASDRRASGDGHGPIYRLLGRLAALAAAREEAELRRRG